MGQQTISRKILCVDDESRLLEAIQRQLRKEFSVSIAESADAGLKILNEEGPFALVISDYNMPVVDGVEFLKLVHERYPATVLVMLTGRAELDVAVRALHKGHISRFLSKPCPRDLLVQTIKDCLEQYRLIMSEQQLKHELELSNQRLNELNQHLEELVSLRTQALATQYRYARSLTQMESSAQVADAFLDAVKEIAQHDRLALFLKENLGSGEFLPHAYGGAEALPSITVVDQRQGVIEAVIRDKQAFVVLNPQQLSESDRKFFFGLPSVCIPLETEKKIIGLLTIGKVAEEACDETLIDSVKSLANATAPALTSHWHLEARNEAQDAIITALAKLSEYKDTETGAHLLRLKKYCGLICRLLSVTEKYRHIVTPLFTEDLVRSSPLHDIGKVGIPDAILKKPGKLTEEEFEVMKTHASIGGDTLRSVYERYKSQTFIKSGMEVAYCHHEKWDGSGYPNGLKAEQIPLTARILTLADVYDALTMRRVYKPPFSREKTKEIILSGSANHFDPFLVELFIANEPLFNEIAENMADNI